MGTKDKGFSTKSIHSGEKLCPLTGSITTPIYQASTFGFTDLDSFKKAMADPPEGYYYSRYTNPTFEAVEQTIVARPQAGDGVERIAVFHQSYRKA